MYSSPQTHNSVIIYLLSYYFKPLCCFFLFMGHKRRSLLKQYNSFVWGTDYNLSHYSLINFPSVSCRLLQNKTQEFRVTWSVQLVNTLFFWTGSVWWIGWFVRNSVHFTNTMIQNQQLTEGEYYQWITALNWASF